MFGNNKQETIARINELTNEAEKLNRKIFKLKTFIEAKELRTELTDDEKTYVEKCNQQVTFMNVYYEQLQDRAVLLQHSLEKEN